MPMKFEIFCRRSGLESIAPRETTTAYVTSSSLTRLTRSATGHETQQNEDSYCFQLLLSDIWCAHSYDIQPTLLHHNYS